MQPERGLVAALLLACGAASAAVPLIPVKDFARKSDFESAKVSPTGEYLAVAIPSDDQTMLGVINLKNNKISGALKFTPGKHVSGFWWVGPERVVVSIAERDGPLDQPRPTGELYAMNADGSEKKYLFGQRGAMQTGTRLRIVTMEQAWAYMADPLPHDKDSALIVVVPWSRGPDVRSVRIERINVWDGRHDLVSVVPGYTPIDAVADRTGRLRFAYSSDQKSRHHLYVPADTPVGWKELAHPQGPAEWVVIHGTSPDGNSVFLTSAEADGRTCLREYRFAESALKERRCGDVGDPVLSLDRDAVIGLRHEVGAPEIEFLADEHPDAKLLKSLQKAFGSQRVTVTSTTLDGKQAVVYVDSDRNPGDYFLVDRATRKAQYLMSARQWIDPASMAPVAPIAYKTRDGATIYGYLTSHGGTDVRQAPLVLLPHGGPHQTRDYWQWDAWAQLLANRGYAVLQVNYRGSPGYGQAHEHAGYRKWGTLMQDDLTDAVRWAVDQKIADPSRVCIFGASFGGYAALMSATREPDLYRCAIGLAGVYDLAADASDSDISETLMGRNYLERVLGDEAQMREQSPITHIEKLKAPVLIVHGTADRRVPFSQATRLRKALDRHGKTYEWMEVKGEEHGFYLDANREAFLTHLLEFLDRHIGARAKGAEP